MFELTWCDDMCDHDRFDIESLADIIIRVRDVLYRDDQWIVLEMQDRSIATAYRV